MLLYIHKWIYFILRIPQIPIKS
ncbi:hypothetical protein PFNF54_04315 [Plasmodium falciparum NF54]|uniref:Uncharacterized protein n=1 Tax=Plasmodium falciparum (isolate NF54) TaxID=5843 RepID=W7KAU5_PLAFO|nr:hypothetical protein PFNF54_04315 [Plasmodium falciparum NF54]